MKQRKGRLGKSLAFFWWGGGELTVFVRGHKALNIKPLALSWEPLEKHHDSGFQGQKKATGPEVRGGD